MCDQQITLSKPILNVIMAIIADFVPKPFSSKQVCKHINCLKLFSALAWLVLTLQIKI